MTNRPGRFARTLLFVLILGLISGCQTSFSLLQHTQTPFTAASPAPSISPSPAATNFTPTITPSLTPTGITLGSPEGNDSAPRTGSSCPLDLENQAVRQNVNINWQKLGPLTCYRLTLDLTSEDHKEFSGTSQVEYTNTTGDVLDDLVFRVYPNARVIYGGALQVTAASVADTQVEPETFLADDTAVRIPLPVPLQPDETVSVHLDFIGQAPENFGSTDVYGIFNYDPDNEMLILANWYPILAVRSANDWQAAEVSSVGDAVNSETALYQVTVSVPEGWKLATTGVQLEPQTDDDKGTYQFVSGPTRDFMIVGSPYFTTSEIPFQDVTITHWQLPDIPYSDSILDVAYGSMDLYTQLFGDYPYTQLDIVDVPLQNAGGVEYPGLILVENGLYGRSESADYLNVVISHEIGHQWWYSVIGNDVYAYPWQDEALATFSSLLYFQEYDADYYHGELSYYRDSIDQYQSRYGQAPISQPVIAFENAPGSAYSVIVYLKGALFFVELRDQIGDEAFFGALHSYYQNGMFTVVSPEVLLRAFERSCNCDLSDFYAEWGVIE